MSRPRGALVAILVLLAITSLAPLAAAQDGGNETTTTTPTTEENETSSLVAEVDEDVRVEAYEYDEDSQEFLITFSSVGDRRVDVTVTEVIDQRSGSSGTFGVEQFTLRPGETVEVSVSARQTHGSAAVMIVTQKSLDRGQGTFLMYDPGTTWISGKPTWWLIRVSALGGIIGVSILILGMAWHKVADSNDDIEVKA